MHLNPSFCTHRRALVGCILTDQVPYMIVTSAFFVASDVILLAQYMFYAAKKGPILVDKAVPLLSDERKGEGSATISPIRQNFRRIVVIMVLCLALAAFIVSIKGGTWWWPFKEEVTVDPLPLCSPPPASTDPVLVLVGTLLSWFANITYIAARMPQIILNYRRRSCEGLSSLMFICSISGNAAYALAILLKMHVTSALFWENTSPYLFSCLATILTDLVILYQARIFSQLQ